MASNTAVEELMIVTWSLIETASHFGIQTEKQIIGGYIGVCFQVVTDAYTECVLGNQ